MNVRTWFLRCHHNRDALLSITSGAWMLAALAWLGASGVLRLGDVHSGAMCLAGGLLAALNVVRSVRLLRERPGEYMVVNRLAVGDRYDRELAYTTKMQTNELVVRATERLHGMGKPTPAVSEVTELAVQILIERYNEEYRRLS